MIDSNLQNEAFHKSLLDNFFISEYKRILQSGN
jgi:hypothetical protein